MIPENENVHENAETSMTSMEMVENHSKRRQETEVASVTAWKRYENFVTIIESRGGNYNRQSAIEAMFRGGDLVYVGH